MRVLLLGLLFALPAWGAEGGVRLLERAGGHREEAALLEALRIYMHDLAVGLTASTLPPDAEVGDERKLAVAHASCGTSTALVLWLSRRDAGLLLFGWRCATKELRSLPFAPADDLDLAAQTLALKVRGLLVRGPGEETDWRSVPAPPRQPASSPAPTVAASSTSPVSAVAPSPTISKTGAGGGKRGAGLELALAYGFDMPTDVSWLRHGLVIRLGIPLTRVPLVIELDGSVTTHPRHGADGDQVSITEIPLGLALAVRLQRGRWLFELGPRFSLHIVMADGMAAGGRSGSASNVSVGLGAVGQMRYNIWRELGILLVLNGDFLLPEQRFTLDGQERVDLGLFQWGASLGVAYRFF